MTLAFLSLRYLGSDTIHWVVNYHKEVEMNHETLSCHRWPNFGSWGNLKRFINKYFLISLLCWSSFLPKLRQTRRYRAYTSASRLWNLLSVNAEQ